MGRPRKDIDESAVRELVGKGHSYPWIARRYKVSTSLINQIVLGTRNIKKEIHDAQR